MPKIRDLIKRHQPEEYAKLMAMLHVVEANDSDAAMREIERLMSHSIYDRGRGGAIKQIRQD